MLHKFLDRQYQEEEEVLDEQIKKVDRIEKKKNYSHVKKKQQKQNSTIINIQQNTP